MTGARSYTIEEICALAVSPASDLEELAERLQGWEAEPDPLKRRLVVLGEVSGALQGASPTLRQIWTEARDALRRARVGPAARPVAEIDPLIEAAAAVTFLMDDKNIPTDAAHALAAKYASVDKKKLESFRQNIQRGRQAPDVLLTYEVRLSLLRVATFLPPQLQAVLNGIGGR